MHERRCWSVCNHKAKGCHVLSDSLASFSSPPHLLSDMRAQLNQCLSPHRPQGHLPQAVARHTGLLSQNKTLPPSCQLPLPPPPPPLPHHSGHFKCTLSQHCSGFSKLRPKGHGWPAIIQGAGCRTGTRLRCPDTQPRTPRRVLGEGRLNPQSHLQLTFSPHRNLTVSAPNLTPLPSYFTVNLTVAHRSVH